MFLVVNGSASTPAVPDWTSTFLSFLEVQLDGAMAFSDLRFIDGYVIASNLLTLPGLDVGEHVLIARTAVM